MSQYYFDVIRLGELILQIDAHFQFNKKKVFFTNYQVSNILTGTSHFVAMTPVAVHVPIRKASITPNPTTGILPRNKIYLKGLYLIIFEK
jgi:hypothetical protein